jgi:Tfp pilus assembly protein PilV
MPNAARRSSRGAFGRLADESGLTIFETLVAAVLLIVGIMATFVLIDVANSTSASSSAREGATSLSRELLEDAHATPYAQVGSSGWIQSKLQGVSGGTGTVTNPSSNTQQTTVTRRGVTYTVTVSWCSEDDGKDGYGTHGISTPWCSDSTSTGTTDGQAEDFKRVTATIDWAGGGISTQLKHTATFSSTGAAVGPATTGLSITTPTGVNQSAPVITANPAGGNVIFLGTAPGAADMKFSVNGSEQLSGVTNNSNGTWSFSWNITNLKDGTYTISAVAVDILGTRGQPRTMSVVLNRGAPAALSGLTGGYNYVNVAGTKTLVTELAWDANPEGSVTGYQVERGATVVCSASLNTSCIDLSAPSSGTTTYTVKTLYKDSAGNTQSISTTYPLTAPTGGAFPTQWAVSTSTANTGTNCLGTTSPVTSPTLQTDFVSTFPSGTTSSIWPGTTGTAAYLWICLPPFPTNGYALTTGNTSVTMYYKNGNGACTIFWYLMLGQSTFLSQNSFPLTINDAAAKAYTSSAVTTAHTFTAGQQLALYSGVHNAPGNKSTCQTDQFYYNSTTTQTKITLPITSPAGNSLQQPAVPTGLTIAHNADGTNTLTWNAATGSPAPDFYRIYRDGQNYTNRYDTAGDNGSATVSWTDTSTGGTTHTYYVTTAATTLTESATMAGPVS